MVVLSSETIRKMLRSGLLEIRPLEDEQIQPASVDLRIAGEVMLMEAKEIVFGEKVDYQQKKTKNIAIPPKTFALVRTIEYIRLPKDVAGVVKLRSSLSRIGFFLNNAGWVDPGFEGTLTLSIFNSSNAKLILHEGQRFAQLVLLRLDSESEGYSGKYSGQTEVTGSKEYIEIKDY